MKSVFMSFLALAIMPAAYASELDKPNSGENAIRLAADLPASLVVRKSADGQVAVFHSASLLGQGDESVVANGSFTNMTANEGQRQELDQNSSQSGWYFYWNNWNYSYPTYYYGGYQYYYQQYYSHFANNYWYYWYRWYW
jgi:acetyl-CoA acetyltransferase